MNALGSECAMTVVLFDYTVLPIKLFIVTLFGGLECCKYNLVSEVTRRKRNTCVCTVTG